MTEEVSGRNPRIQRMRRLLRDRCFRYDEATYVVEGPVLVAEALDAGREVRQVVGIERRLNEAHRLGFQRAIVPATTPEVAVGLDVVRVSTVAEAVAVAGLLPGAAGEAGRDPVR